jgi:hypothetical protein
MKTTPITNDQEALAAGLALVIFARTESQSQRALQLVDSFAQRVSPPEREWAKEEALRLVRVWESQPDYSNN